MPSLRLLSVDARAVGYRRARLAQVITAADADVVCVHSAPHLLRWRAAGSGLARRTARVVVSGGGRASGANLLLSSLSVAASATRDLRFAGTGGSKPPGATLAALQVHGQGFVLVGATLVGNAAQRLAQAGELQTAVETLVPGPPPAVICAQGTDRPGTAAWQTLTDNRVAVVGRVFVDDRFAVHDERELAGGSVLVELTL